MRSILAIAVKDIRLLVRDRAAMMWVAAFPVVMAVLFGSIYGGMDGGSNLIDLGLVDLDGGARAKAIAKSLEDSKAVNLKPMSLTDAQERVRKGDLGVYVVIQKGIGQATMMSPPEKPLIQLGADPKRQMESGMLEGLLSQAWFEQLGKDMPFASAIMKQGSGVERVAVQRKQDGPTSSYQITFPQAMLWGLLSVCASFAVTMVKERTMGTLLRLRLSPVSRWELMLGKGLACFVTCLCVVAGLLVLGVIAFKMRALDHPLQLVLAVVCVAACYSGLMMLVSVLGKTEQSVGGAGWGVLMLFSMFGGGMVPLIMMPGWMQAIGNFSPAKWSILALEGAIWRGFSVAEMAGPCAILLASGAAAFALGSWVMGRRDG